VPFRVLFVLGVLPEVSILVILVLVGALLSWL
jgi:hypothetical protein